MKKKYTKPYIYIESFQLDAALASGCSPEFAGKVNNTESDCGYLDGSSEGKDFLYFNWKNCAFDLSYEDGNDALCYHGPDITNKLVFFAS